MFKVVTVAIFAISLLLTGCSKQNDGSKNEIKEAFGYTFGEKVNNSMFSNKATVSSYANREKYTAPYEGIFGVKSKDTKYDYYMVATNADDEIYNINAYKKFANGTECKEFRQKVLDSYLKKYNWLQQKLNIDERPGGFITLVGGSMKIVVGNCSPESKGSNAKNDFFVWITNNAYRPGSA